MLLDTKFYTGVTRLPRWAEVAHAARSARRVQPLFRTMWPNAPLEFIKAVEAAVYFAEDGAAEGKLPVQTDHLVEVTHRAARMALIEPELTRSSFKTKDGYSVLAAGASTVARSAAVVLACAKKACRDFAYSRARTDQLAHKTIDCAISAAYCQDLLSNGPFAEEFDRPYQVEISADFEMLKSASERERWNHETLVTPAFFGQLWRFGVPDWWPPA